ncbi:MG2 domain-containing protein [Roseateles sp.]|uniref:alpha-2-macroglobulin family protein n=1 Tax=Roseateles sp. TaxID=1971397 RepID=UPI003266CDAA
MPNTPAARPFATRMLAACVLAMAPLLAGAVEPVARVLTFSPQGQVPGAEQVRATFSEPMVPMGKVAAPGPFDVDCGLAGEAHWVDDRTWVMDLKDLKDQTRDGRACEFRVRPALTSLAGHAVGEPLAFRFQLPALTDEMKRNVAGVYPHHGAAWVAEDQVFLLRYTHPLGGTPTDVRCEAPGHPEAPAVHLPTEVRDGLKKQASWMWEAPDRLEAVRCPFALAPERPVTLRLVRPTLKPYVMSYTARALPAVTVACRRLQPDGDCAANFPIALEFNAAMPAALLREIKLDVGQGLRPGTVTVRPATLTSGASGTVTFEDGFQPGAEYQIHWPGQDFVDDAGRKLARDRRPASIKTLPALGLAYFPVPTVSIRPLQADNPFPVFLQGAATRPAVRAKVVGAGDGGEAADKLILQWMGLRGANDGVHHYFSMPDAWRPRGRVDPPLLGDAAAIPLQAVEAAASSEARGGRVALKGAGLHLLELQAFADQGDAAPAYDSVAVLLTRLAVHLKVAEANSAVWVTQLDGGAPVAAVDLRAYDCHGVLVWQGRSDANGLASIDRRSLAICSKPPDAGVTVVARHTWPDGERDVSVANSRWTGLLDAASYGIHETWGGTTVRAHTVLDRSLFKPGETVSMRHVVRRENIAGLAAGELPRSATMVHLGSGKTWTVPLEEIAPGEGLSRFELPGDAPLGSYTVLLKLGEGSSLNVTDHDTAAFAVEAFRLPGMLGAIQAPRLIFGAAPTLQLRLHHADGGAAQHWPVTLKVYARAWGDRESALLDGYADMPAFLDEAAAAKPEPDQLLLDMQSLQLDAQGHAQATLLALPSRARPYVLRAELSYQDPNGEAQTVSQGFDVLPSLLTVGVRTRGSVAVQRPLEVQSLVLDENGARRGRQPVSVSAKRRDGYGSGDVEDLGEVCKGLTDAKGELVCGFVPRKAGVYQFEAAATDPDGRVAAAYSVPIYANAQRLPAGPLFVSADKTLYREGEMASLAVSSPFKRSRVWLTLERRGVLESRVLTLDAAQARIPLHIRREWAGNVSVSLLALDADAGPLPAAMATGITELMVSTEAHALRVSLTPDRRRYQPGDAARVRIHVATPDGKPLPAARKLSFVAVDEALLSLKGNPSWQLLARMQAPRLHRVHTTSGLVMNPAVDERAMLRSAEGVLMDFLQHSADKAAGIVTVTGQRSALQSAQRVVADQAGKLPGTGPAAAPPPARALLDALLYWQADVPVDDNGDAVVSFPIKDGLSRFRLVAVASAGSEEFGTGAAHLDVMKDLQLTAGLPPRVREGDRFAALVTVRNTSAGPITLDASAGLSGQAALPAQAVRLAAGEARQLSWEVRVPTGAKALSWTFAAKERGRDGRQDVLETTQQVEPAVPVTVQAATLAQVNGSFDVPAFGFDGAGAVAGTARVSVQLLPSLAGQLGGVQAWLASYPYHCLEQSVSRAVGMHDRKAWDAAMAELPRYLDEDGLANYFPPESTLARLGSDTLTSHLLDLADTSGWPIPEAERKRMLAGLEGFAAGRIKRVFWAPRDDGLARRIGALATLARYQRLAPGQLDAIRVDPDEWTTRMLIDWLTVLRKTDAQPALLGAAGNALRARLTYQGHRMSFSTETRDYWWWLMSHGDVDAARLLLAVADLPDWQADLPRLLTGLLSRQQNNGAWATTNANAWGTLAVDAFARLLEPVPVAGETRIALGQQRKTLSWDEPGSKSFDAPLSKASDALHIQHDGAGAPWASVEVRAAVPLTAPRAAGYSVSRSITPVQQKVPGQWHVGDIARVRLSVRAQADMSWVVLDDPVPAGASILGNGLGRDSAAALAGEQRTGNAWPLYQARDFTSFKSFYRYVPRGDFSLEYTIRLNNPGQFTLSPTRVEAMYAPEVFGEAPNAVFGIEP